MGEKIKLGDMGSILKIISTHIEKKKKEKFKFIYEKTKRSSVKLFNLFYVFFLLFIVVAFIREVLSFIFIWGFFFLFLLPLLCNNFFPLSAVLLLPHFLILFFTFYLTFFPLLFAINLSWCFLYFFFLFHYFITCNVF